MDGFCVWTKTLLLVLFLFLEKGSIHISGLVNAFERAGTFPSSSKSRLGGDSGLLFEFCFCVEVHARQAQEKLKFTQNKHKNSEMSSQKSKKHIVLKQRSSNCVKTIFRHSECLTKVAKSLENLLFFMVSVNTSRTLDCTKDARKSGIKANWKRHTQNLNNNTFG